MAEFKQNAKIFNSFLTSQCTAIENSKLSLELENKTQNALSTISLTKMILKRLYTTLAHHYLHVEDTP